MNRLARRALPVLLCILTGAGNALTPDDFARGREVVPDSGLVQRVIVPEDVYRWTTRTDLGDLRVLDAAGNPAPFAVRAPQATTPPPAWQPLPWFALPTPVDTADAPASVNVQLGADGTVVAVQGAAGDATARPAFLLDASTLERPIGAIRPAVAPGRGGFRRPGKAGRQRRSEPVAHPDRVCNRRPARRRRHGRDRRPACRRRPAPAVPATHSARR
jgi:hypothetical protein